MSSDYARPRHSLGRLIGLLPERIYQSLRRTRLREAAVEECCTATAQEYLIERLGGLYYDAPLTDYLTGLAKRWGELADEVRQQVVIACSTAPGLGIDARTGLVPCETCGRSVPYVIVGSRLCHFVWRVMMALSRGWEEPRMDGYDTSRLSPRNDWPDDADLAMIGRARRQYLSDTPVAYEADMIHAMEHVSGDRGPALALHQAVIDMAELFVLMHEVQHHLRWGEGADPLGLKIPAPEGLDLSAKQRLSWSDELSHDANGLYALLLSVVCMLEERGMPTANARIQAAMLACAGADAAMFAIQQLQESGTGPFPLEEAVYNLAYVRHPPAQMRRDHLSQVGCLWLTGRPVQNLQDPAMIEAWGQVAGNLRLQMGMLDRLFSEFEDQYDV